MYCQSPGSQAVLYSYAALRFPLDQERLHFRSVEDFRISARQVAAHGSSSGTFGSVRRRNMLGKENWRTPRRAVFQALMLLLGIGFVSGAVAQTSTVGSINGTVRDPAGAAVPKAEVVI